LLIKEFRLRARSIFVIDPSDVIRYMEVVTEIADQPDYGKALAEAGKL